MDVYPGRRQKTMCKLKLHTCEDLELQIGSTHANSIGHQSSLIGRCVSLLLSLDDIFLSKLGLGCCPPTPSPVAPHTTKDGWYLWCAPSWVRKHAFSLKSSNGRSRALDAFRSTIVPLVLNLMGFAHAYRETQKESPCQARGLEWWDEVVRHGTLFLLSKGDPWCQ